MAELLAANQITIAKVLDGEKGEMSAEQIAQLNQASEDASQAKSDVANLEIGGRNLLIGSEKGVVNTNADTSSLADLKLQVYNGKTYVGLEFRFGVTAGEHIEYTYTSQYSGDRVIVGDNGGAYDGVETFLVSEYKEGVVYTLSCDVIDDRPNVVGGYVLKNIKLEKGNKATDWTPAPEDVDAGIDNAAKVATNFINYDSTNGLVLGNKESGSWVGYRTQILSDRFNILDESSTVLASFGTTTVIGEEAKANMHLTFNNLSMVDKDGTKFFEVGDNRNAEWIATVKYKDTGYVYPDTGSAVVVVYSRILSIVSVYVDSVELSSSEYSFSGQRVTINNLTPNTNIYVEITYTTLSPYFYLTFGKRLPSSEIGMYSVAEGRDVTASGYASHAEGMDTIASEQYSHAEGCNTTASSARAHAEGYNTTASGNESHAEGYNTTASSGGAHAEGRGTTASHSGAHAEGGGTTANGNYSHAEGYYTTASGQYSHAGGYYTKADGNYMTAIGKYNTEKSGKAFVIGNGTSDTACSDAFAVDWNGNTVMKGGLALGTALSIANGGTDATSLAGAQENLGIKAISERIDNLILGTGTSPVEVQDARLSGDGTRYTTLKSRLDAENSELKSDLTSETNARVNADNALSARITNKVAQPLDGNNQPTNGTSGQSLRTKGDGTTEWASVGLPTYAQTADAVSTWLNEHPEATTTVQDGSLTYQKFVIGTLGYVTPEMFGAKANDNSFDNAEAFTNAINSGYPVKSFGGTYYFATELIIQNKTGADLDFTPSTFVYTGTEYLINFIALRASTIRLGVINALSGGAIRFTGENSDSWSQYDNVYFREIRANTDCIFIEQKEGGYWCNEINFHNGRFISGDVGLHIMLSSTTDANSHVNTYNIGVEGVTTGFFFENLSDGNKAIRHGMFVNTRFEESFTYLARSVGVVTSMLFISPYSPNANMLSVSGLSDGWQFVDSTRGNQCTVINGRFYAYGIPQLTYGGRGLAENTDLNDIVECGSYYVATVATAQTILNKPNINEVFRLNVISLSGGDVRGEWMNKKQIIEYRNHRYSRYITSDGSGNRTYSAWKADMSNVAPSVLTTPITAGADITFNSYTKAVYDEKMVMLHLDFTTSAGIPAWQTLFTLAENIRPQATRNCSMNGISGTAFVNTDGNVANSSGIPTGSHIVADLIYFL